MVKSAKSHREKYIRYMSLLRQEGEQLPPLQDVANLLEIPNNTLSRYFKEEFGRKYDVLQHIFNEKRKKSVNVEQRDQFVNIFSSNNCDKEYWILSSEFMSSERDFTSQELNTLKIPSRSIHRKDLTDLGWKIPKNVIIIMLSVSLSSKTHHEVMKHVHDNEVYIVSGYKKVVKKDNAISMPLNNVYGSTNNDFIRRKDKTAIRVFIDNCLDYLSFKVDENDSYIVDIKALFKYYKKDI